MARNGRVSSIIAAALCGALLLPGSAAAAPGSGDRDGDGMPNRWEKDHKLDPTRRNALGDPDGDGLTNIAEYRHRTDPRSSDTDGAGLSDRHELARFRSSPKTRDTDRDGIRDGWEDGNENGILDEGEDGDRQGFVGVTAYWDLRHRELVIELATGWPILAYVPAEATLVMEKGCDYDPYQALDVMAGVDVLELYLQPNFKQGMVVIDKMFLGCPEDWMFQN